MAWTTAVSAGRRMAALDVAIRPIGADRARRLGAAVEGLSGLLQGRDLRCDHRRDLGAAARSGGADGRARRAYVDGKLCGIVHYLFHRSCWTVGDYCYLQDLFVAEGMRNLGLGRADRGGGGAGARGRRQPVYWLTHETNTDARALYDKLAERSGFIQYRKLFEADSRVAPMSVALTIPTSPTRRLFLGVERSVCGRAWRDRLDEQGAGRALAIAQRHDDVPSFGAHPRRARVAVDEVATFLDPTVRALMPSRPARRHAGGGGGAADAVRRGETVAIFGDYDVDGATSAAAGALSAPMRACADHPSRSPVRRLRPQRGGGARARRPGRDAGHRRLRHQQPRAAGAGASSVSTWW